MRTTKNYKKEKIPSAANSKDWQLYYKGKELKTLKEGKKMRFEEGNENCRENLQLRNTKSKRKKDEYSDTTTYEWELSGICQFICQ